MLRSKCIPVLLYGVESTMYRTASAVVVTECQKLISFLSFRYQADIRTASFMLRFMATEDYICNLFAIHADCCVSYSNPLTFG